MSYEEGECGETPGRSVKVLGPIFEIVSQRGHRTFKDDNIGRHSISSERAKAHPKALAYPGHQDATTENPHPRPNDAHDHWSRRKPG